METTQGSPPRWLKIANPLVITLQRLGLRMGTIHILSVPGRKSGTMRRTPVSLLTVDGTRYLVAGLSDADWVRNARAAGWGFLAWGRRSERVTLTEVPVEERAAILREFPRRVPAGVSFFRRLCPLPNDAAALPDAFATLATRAPVFRVERAPTPSTVTT